MDFPTGRYPTQMIDVWRLPGGRRVTLRPVLAQDDALFADFLARQSRRALLQRFHGAVSPQRASSCAAMATVDYRTSLALVLTSQEAAGEAVVAEARYVRVASPIDASPDGESAEFALVVDDGWRQLGLGTRLLRCLANHASERGVRWLYGNVHENNRAMLALSRRLGFCVSPDGDDAAILHVERALPLTSVRRPAHLIELMPWAWRRLTAASHNIRLARSTSSE